MAERNVAFESRHRINYFTDDRVEMNKLKERGARIEYCRKVQAVFNQH